MILGLIRVLNQRFILLSLNIEKYENMTRNIYEEFEY